MLYNSMHRTIRNPNAAHRYIVEMHYGPTRWWTAPIPADTEHEAEVIANNEHPRAISTGRIEQID